MNSLDSWLEGQRTLQPTLWLGLVDHWPSSRLSPLLSVERNRMVWLSRCLGSSVLARVAVEHGTVAVHVGPAASGKYTMEF